ncbi:MAG TPA: ABC transporter permease [Acetobacteraceae bacterium]|nr:ABC transporter permease [Acetobacteraceae bacterium]
MKSRRLWLFTLTSVAFLLVVWTAVTAIGAVNPLFLPGPGLLASSFVDLTLHGYKGYSLPEHIGISLMRVALGFGTGTAVGTIIGLGMGMVPLLDAFVAPFVEFLRPLPQLAYLVLLIVWFGIGETSKIVLLFLTALPVAAIAARDGVRSVPRERVLAARALGATPMQIFIHVVFPSALPEIFIGARLAVGIVYATLIAAEIIAGSDGIGWLVFDAGRFLRSDYVFVGVLLIGLMGLGIDRALSALERRIVHWAGR